MGRLSIRPVNSEKKEITWSNLSQDASSTIEISLIKGVDPSAVNLATEVSAGSTVKWIYLEFNVSAETITNTKIFHWMVVKKPFGAALGAAPNTYNNDFKRFILKRGMEMLPKDVGTVTKRIMVVKIPPRMRRFGQDDELFFSYIMSSSQTINCCGIGIFKRFS